MKTDVDQLAVLKRLRDEGRISAEEYEDFERETLEIDDVQMNPEGEQNPPPTESSPSTFEDEEPEHVSWLALRVDLSPAYLVVFLLASAILLVASSLGVLSWLVTTVIILGLGATLVQGGHWVTIAGGLAVAGIMIVGLFGGSSKPPDVQAFTDDAGVTPAVSIPGSLGISIKDLTDLWNTVDESPKISRGLVYNSEAGQYDSFIYRFGDWGRLAGAHDPSTDAVYALLATGQVSNEATTQLYLHLCFVLNPYSQECIDSYFEKGLADGTLTDFIDLSHQAEWQMGDQTWRLEIEGNVLTIRVLGTAVS